MPDELSLGDRKAVQQILEKSKDEVQFIGWVTKRGEGKPEKRICVVGKNRLYSVRPGGKLAREGHWLDLLEIVSKSKTEVNFTFRAFKLNITTDSTDEIIHQIRTSYSNAFPDFPEKHRYKLEVSPSSRLKDLTETEKPLGGYITTYLSMCDYYQAEVREDIVWDLENLFISSGMKAFNLKEFTEIPLTLNDVKTLLGALSFNTYFRSFSAKGIALDKGMVECVASLLKRNTKLEELNLAETGLNSAALSAICDALASNPHLALTSLILGGNILDDKAGQSLGQYLSSMSRGLVRLDLNGTQIGKAGMSAVCSALKKNVHMSSSLSFFDITNNKLESDGSSALANFLASPNSIRSLIISNTVANLDILLGALLRGSNEITHLDLSGNKFSKKEAPTLSKFLQSSANLSVLNLSNTQIPVENVKDIITALCNNLYLKDATLNLAENKLGVAGARLIASLADKMVNIAAFNLNDNELNDDGISVLCEGLCFNTNIKRLYLDNNFKSKSKMRQNAMEAIVRLIGPENQCPIETLSLTGNSKANLGLDILPLFHCLATNEKLVFLDVSGNGFGNRGAAALGKALQTNEKLETLLWDANGTTLDGFQSFNTGLKRNRHLKNSPVPINDVARALGIDNPKELNDTVTKMQQNVLKNQGGGGASLLGESEDVELGQGGSSFGFLSSGGREEVVQMLHKIKGTGRKVPEDKKILMEDAEVQDQTMTHLFSLKEEVSQEFELVLKMEIAKFSQSSFPVFGKLKSKLISRLLDSVKLRCKSLPEETVKRLETNLAYGGGDMPEDEFEKILMDKAFKQLNNLGVNALATVVSIASDYLYEKTYDLLREIFDDLSEDIRNEEAKKAEAAAAKAAPPPVAAKKPEPPKKEEKKEEKKAPAPPAAASKPSRPAGPPKGGKKEDKKSEPEGKVQELPKAESNLEHATKGRPVNAGRRPPTRKPRPAPPSGS